MRGERIRIDGQPLDLFHDGNRMAMNISSNIMCKMADYQCCYTYSYSVPYTERNKQILGRLMLPGADGKAVRKYLEADYERDGIRIFSGRAMVTAATREKVSLSLLFGINEGLQHLLDDDREIWQLNWNNTERIDVASDNKQTGLDYWIAGSAQPSVFFYFMNRRVKGDNPGKWANVPISVSASRILGKIEEEYGLLFGKQPSGGIFLQYNPTWRKAGAFSIRATKTHYEMGDYGSVKWIKASAFEVYDGEVTGKDIEERYDNHTPRLYGKAVINRIAIAVENSENTTVNVQFVYYEQNNEKLIKSGEQMLGIAPPKGRLDLTFEPKDMGMSSEYQPVSIVVSNGVPTNLRNIKVGMYVYCEFEASEVESGHVNPAHCMPAIKCADFVNSLLFLDKGAFTINSIKQVDIVPMASVDDIAISEPYDWSERLLDDVEACWQLDDIAQNNWIAWADDESEPRYKERLFDHAITCNDPTLEYDDNFFELPFSRSANNADQPVFYTYDGFTDEKLSPAPRLVVDDGGAWEVENPHDSKDTKRYQGYYQAGVYWERETALSKTMSEPSSIKCKVRLTTLEFANLDLSRRVYLRQVGKYYFIKEMKLGGDNIAEVELVELKQID